MKKNWVAWDNVSKELMADPEMQAAFDEGDRQFEVASSIMDARLAAGLTQAELAEKMGTKQSVIARVESGRANPSINFLRRIAKGTGQELVLRIR